MNERRRKILFAQNSLLLSFYCRRAKETIMKLLLLVLFFLGISFSQVCIVLCFDGFRLGLNMLFSPPSLFSRTHLHFFHMLFIIGPNLRSF